MLMFDAFVWAGFGLIFGSFANVLILRHGTGKSINGRSACLSCATTLTWVDLWPILSYVASQGRCRTCGSRISMQYPLVELTTMLLFVLVGLAPIPLLAKVVSAGIVVFMIAITVYDLYHTIIPDRWVYVLSLLALIYIPLMHPLEGTQTLYAFMAGPLSALPLFVLWGISRGAWMGFGDVKLALPVGWILGPLLGLQAILVAFFLGAIVGVALILFPQVVAVFHTRSSGGAQALSVGYTMKSEVPFGPFVIVSFFTLWFAALYAVQLPLPPVLLS